MVTNSIYFVLGFEMEILSSGVVIVVLPIAHYYPVAYILFFAV